MASSGCLAIRRCAWWRSRRRSASTTCSRSYRWLSLVGGGEDVDGVPCHQEYVTWLLGVLALVVGALIELVRRGAATAPLTASVSGVPFGPRPEDRSVSVLGDRHLRILRLTGLVGTLGRVRRLRPAQQPPYPARKPNLAAPWLQILGHFSLLLQQAAFVGRLSHPWRIRMVTALRRVERRVVVALDGAMFRPVAQTTSNRPRADRPSPGKPRSHCRDHHGDGGDKNNDLDRRHRHLACCACSHCSPSTLRPTICRRQEGRALADQGSSAGVRCRRQAVARPQSLRTPTTSRSPVAREVASAVREQRRPAPR